MAETTGLQAWGDDLQTLHPSDWAGLATGGDPFISAAFLGVAEATGAAAEALAWQSCHIVSRTASGGVQGFVPLYLRHHSFGDFSRDWEWAGAWQQAGLRYYPKLVTGVPFTPSPGPRLVVTRGLDPTAARAVKGDLVAQVLERAGTLDVSSWQCLYVEDADREVLAEAGLLLRRGVQFHWLNRDYRDFADFLDRFTADKRKKLKRERRAVAEAGIRVVIRHGDEVEPAWWPAIHRHYRDTFARHGNHAAFSEPFFRQVAAGLGRRMVLFVALKGEQPVASAICYRDDTTLYGRHWGTDLDLPGLHFELCYYSGIDYALEQGLVRFEPGAQGEHKLARGFEPQDTWSGYWIADPGMARAVARFLAREDEAMVDYRAEMAQHLPFKTVGG
ncbi:MAG: GNAT family N-acetyltransferase [Pseudomonadota bacterium]